MNDDAEDGFAADTTELLQCAQINFENAEKMVPGLAGHPIFRMAKMQLDAVVKRLDVIIAQADKPPEHRGPLDGLLEPGAAHFDVLTSIGISLKRLADHLAPNDGKHSPPLLWLGDVLRELKS